MAPHARTRTALLYAAALLVATPALAQHGGSNAAPQAADGQKAAVDANGRIRPITPEEARALIESLAPSLSQSDAGLTRAVLPNGAVAVDLEGRFESATLAKVGADGKVEAECVTTEAEATQFLGLTPATTPGTPAPALEER